MYINFVSGLDNAILFNLVSSVGFDMSYPSKNITGFLRYTAKSKLRVCGLQFSWSISKLLMPGNIGILQTPSKNRYFLYNSSVVKMWLSLKFAEFNISCKFNSLFTVA